MVVRRKGGGQRGEKGEEIKQNKNKNKNNPHIQITVWSLPEGNG